MSYTGERFKDTKVAGTIDKGNDSVPFGSSRSESGVKISCPHCGDLILVRENEPKRLAECVRCEKPYLVDTSTPTPNVTQLLEASCPHCGRPQCFAKNMRGTVHCRKCNKAVNVDTYGSTARVKKG
jgi:DNA-directed RNA polymerase subunit RPC12/RpoP